MNTIIIKNNKTPLVSYALLTYNQENYVAEALKSAFTQNYDNLEIIISDDFSTDNTVNIIKETLKKYNGKHNILFIEQTKNKGICEHINSVCKLFNGEIVVFSAGDDISKDDRVKKIVEKFDENPKAAAVWSNLTYLNVDGAKIGAVFNQRPDFSRTIRDFKKGRACWVIGASLAISKDVFTTFDKLNDQALQEDGILAFRALLLGGIEYIDESLVGYRIHSNNVSQTQDPKKRLKLQVRQHHLYESYYNDLIKIVPSDEFIKCKLKILYMMYKCRSFLFQKTNLGIFYNSARIKLAKLKK